MHTHVVSCSQPAWPRLHALLSTLSWMFVSADLATGLTVVRDNSSLESERDLAKALACPRRRRHSSQARPAHTNTAATAMPPTNTHGKSSSPRGGITGSPGSPELPGLLELPGPPGSLEAPAPPGVTGWRPEAQKWIPCLAWNHCSPVLQGCCAQGLEVMLMLQFTCSKSNVSSGREGNSLLARFLWHSVCVYVSVCVCLSVSSTCRDGLWSQLTRHAGPPPGETSSRAKRSSCCDSSPCQRGLSLDAAHPLVHVLHAHSQVYQAVHLHRVKAARGHARQPIVTQVSVCATRVHASVATVLVTSEAHASGTSTTYMVVGLVTRS